MSTHVLARLSARRRHTYVIAMETRRGVYGFPADRLASPADYFDALTLVRRGF